MMETPELTIEQKGKQRGSPNRAKGIDYYPAGPITKDFIRDTSFISGIMGPIGSGKSTAAIIKLIKNCQQQQRAEDGWIYRRTAIIRNTYPELRTTTMKSWHQWVPQHIGRWRDAGPPTHHIIDEANKINWEVIFVALDRPDDISKLLSMELSDAWVNEAREVPKAIIDALTGRVGRYPPRWLAPCTNAQINMDTNPPDTTSWWYVLAERDLSNERNRQIIQSIDEAETQLRMMGVLKGDQVIVRFFRQPGGTSEGAENIKNLPPGYYQLASAGKDQDYIKVYVNGEYGFVMDGKPVHPDYKESTHVRTFDVVSGIGLRLGFDFGLTPACSISQRLPNGRWLVHDEIVSERLGVKSFAEEVKRVLAEKYAGHTVISGSGDPSGDAMTPEESTCFKILNAAGVIAVPAPTNDPVRRHEALGFLLKTLVDGEPGILVHTRCLNLRKGLAGGYHYRRLMVAGEMKYREVPEKNQFSHICEALEYDLIGAGEDRNVTINPAQRSMPRRETADSDYDEFNT